MKREFDYYRIHRKGDSNIPLLAPDTGSYDYLYEGDRIENPKLMLFRLGAPIPRKPIMADYLSTPNSVISKKIYNVLSALNIEGIQLLPARICVLDDEIFTEYWAIHVFNSIRCIDLARSECEINSLNIGFAKKIILDKKKLSSIPLRKRLIFRLDEDFAYQLYHISIVEKILEVNPLGIKFTNIEEWNERSLFIN